MHKMLCIPKTQQASLVQSTPTPIQQKRREVLADFDLAKNAPIDSSLLSTSQFFVPTPFLKVTLNFTSNWYHQQVCLWEKKIWISIFCAVSIDCHLWIKLQTHVFLKRGTLQVRRQLSPQLIKVQWRHCPAIGFVHAGQVRCCLLLVGAGMGGKVKMLKKSLQKRMGVSMLIQLHSLPCNIR